jgi:hypothetical protein
VILQRLIPPGTGFQSERLVLSIFHNKKAMEETAFWTRLKDKQAGLLS